MTQRCHSIQIRLGSSERLTAQCMLALNKHSQGFVLSFHSIIQNRWNIKRVSTWCSSLASFSSVMLCDHLLVKLVVMEKLFIIKLTF